MKVNINTVKYPFSENGIREMHNDTLDLVFSALAGGNREAIEALYINISIGNRKIVIPTYAEAFEMLFDCLKEIEKEVHQ